MSDDKRDSNDDHLKQPAHQDAPKTDDPIPSDRPHDGLFKWTFSNIDRARAELKAIVPPALANKIDWQSLALADTGTSDVKLKHFDTDLLFSADINASPAYLYLLFEHQSSVDTVMPIRMLGYWIRIIEWHLAQSRDYATKPLPIVIPIVLYHGDRGWNAARSVQQLFDPRLAEDPDVAPFIPHFTFALDDLTRLSDQDIQARAMDLVTTVVLWALRDARAEFEALLDSFERWAHILQRLNSQGEFGQRALHVILRYILMVNGQRAPLGFEAELAQKLTPETKGALMTLAEQLEARGEARGKAEGKAEGERLILLRLLTLKFGELPESLQQRVASANEEQLLSWSERVLTATSLDSVFSD